MKEVLILPFCAALMFSVPTLGRINKALPYVQGTAALAVLVNNGLQIVERWKPKEL